MRILKQRGEGEGVKDLEQTRARELEQEEVGACENKVGGEDGLDVGMVAMAVFHNVA